MFLLYENLYVRVVKIISNGLWHIRDQKSRLSWKSKFYVNSFWLNFSWSLATETAAYVYYVRKKTSRCFYVNKHETHWKFSQLFLNKVINKSKTAVGTAAYAPSIENLTRIPNILVILAEFYLNIKIRSIKNLRSNWATQHRVT